MPKILKSFSLIEIIFAILIVAIITSIALPNLFSLSSNSSFVRLKSDIVTIQNALKRYKDSSLMKNISIKLDTLDEDDTNLFSKILKNPIKTTLDYPSWSKNNHNSYLFHFSQNSELEFIYDKDKLTFSCDKENPLCQKVMQ